MTGNAKPAETNTVRVAIVGASGYTGAELVRLLVRHPGAEIGVLTADRKAGEPFGTVFPHLAGAADLPDLVALERVDWDAVDVVFCGPPHGTTQDVVAALPSRLKVIDLSADFRLADEDTYARWYGHAHRAPALQKDAVYGLSELARDAIAGARLVACPGCYPTAALLPLVPLIEAGGIVPEDIIIAAKSGVSGAGRGLTESTLFAEVGEGIHAYGVASHRHTPEIEQELSGLAGKSLTVTFSPHLMPMKRGLLTTAYIDLKKEMDRDGLHAHVAQFYDSEPFVRVLAPGRYANTSHVAGSNTCDIGVQVDARNGRAVITSAIDNLMKGASSQAIQNMNLMLGIGETTGLDHPPLFP